MTLTASELTWIKQLLADMDIIINTLMRMCCDNKVARYIALYTIFYERTKHIKVDCHFVREKKIQLNEIFIRMK
jgi:hypothetical protein